MIIEKEYRANFENEYNIFSIQLEMAVEYKENLIKEIELKRYYECDDERTVTKITRYTNLDEAERYMFQEIGKINEFQNQFRKMVGMK